MHSNRRVPLPKRNGSLPELRWSGSVRVEGLAMQTKRDMRTLHIANEEIDIALARAHQGIWRWTTCGVVPRILCHRPWLENNRLCKCGRQLFDVQWHVVKLLRTAIMAQHVDCMTKLMCYSNHLLWVEQLVCAHAWFWQMHAEVSMAPTKHQCPSKRYCRTPQQAAPLVKVQVNVSQLLGARTRPGAPSSWGAIPDLVNAN
mmetsp:Transcript_59784/g.155473  ORF Transcript_59784/g.155473 Transcript_59784/m.155473 type:complete len:201 (+) Transcript_59784:2-604(+)